MPFHPVFATARVELPPSDDRPHIRCGGDEGSWDVVSRFGFERRRSSHLIARWSRSLTELRRHELIEKAAAFVPF